MHTFFGSMKAVLGLDVRDVVEEGRIGQQLPVPIDPINGVFKKQFRRSSPLLLRQDRS